MPFLAACPFCPATMKLSRKKLGASVQCEQCGNHFTAVPPDEVTSGPSRYRQLGTGTSATAPSVARDRAETEESSIETTAFPGAAPAAFPPYLPSAPSIPGWINLWGVAALVLTSAALFLATFGLLRGLAIPLAGVGLLACLAGVPLAPRKQLKDFAWLGAGAALASAFLLVALIWPHYLNRFWGMDKPVASVDPATPFLASRNNQVPRGRLLDPQDRVEADKHAVRQGDIHVRVEEVRVELDTSREPPTPKNTVLSLRVSNMGQLRRISYRNPAQAGQQPTLRDNRGKSYALQSSRSGQSAHTLKPFAHVQDQWTCEPVDSGVEYLDLEISAAAWAGKGNCKFRIPRSMIVFPAKE